MTPRGPGSSYAIGLKPTNTASEARAQDSNGALPTGKWTHVAVVVNPASNTTTIFRDGVAVAGTNSSATGATLFQTGAAQTGQIGRSQFADPFFGGDIDDFRIYGSALNASRVADLADATAPSLTAALDPAAPDGENGWYVGAVSVKAVASDAQTGITRLEYRTSSSGTWTTYESPIPAPEGTTEYDFQAVDGGGNTTTAHVSVKRDGTAPVVVLSEGDAGAVTLAATDGGSGVARVEYRLGDSTSWQQYSGPITTTENLVYRARDNAGNVSSEQTYMPPAALVSTEPSVRCVTGSVVAVIRVTNQASESVDVEVATPWGTQTMSSLASERSTSLSFTTRSRVVEGASVDVKATGVTSQRTTATKVAIPDRRCG
jgi:hypothetical protein